MIQRPKLTDLHDFADPIDLQRKMDQRLFVYVEAPEDIDFYRRLLDPPLKPHVEILTPTRDFDSMSDTSSGVLRALWHHDNRRAKVPYVGLCDGDFFMTIERPLDLIETADLLIEPDFDVFDANIVLLGFHEKENVMICEGDAIALFCLSSTPDGRGMVEPEQLFEDRMALALANARENLEFAITDFAKTTVHAKVRYELGPDVYLVENLYRAEVARGRREIAARIPSSAVIAQRDPGGSLPPEHYELFRLCRGKEVFNFLEAKSGNEYFRAAVIANLYHSAFGKAFRAMLRRRVRQTLGIELGEHDAEDPIQAPTSDEGSKA